MAGELVQVIVDLQRDVHTGNEPIITRYDALCVKIAALCYNLGESAYSRGHTSSKSGVLFTGYGPFSHVFDQMCSDKIEEWSVSHVQYS